MSETCGCRIERGLRRIRKEAGFVETTTVPPRIIFCPLHQAAEKLRNALEAWITVEPVLDKITLVRISQDALTAAEGRTGA